MVGIIKNIVVIVIAFDFFMGPGHDQVNPGRDIASPGGDMSSGYILEFFFNLAQFGPDRDFHGPGRDHDFKL